MSNNNFFTASGKRREKGKDIPQKGRTPRLREEEAADLFWPALGGQDALSPRPGKSVQNQKKIMKITRLFHQ